MTLKFYYNGIKDVGGKLQRCWYSPDPRDGKITIYARDYKRFSDGVREAFVVENDTDTMTDYFEQDRIRVALDHPLYAEVKAAAEKVVAHREKRCATSGGGSPEYNAAFAAFLDGCKRIVAQNAADMRREHLADEKKWAVNNGKRYDRIVHNGSVYCFVDNTNGNVLKADGFKTPAKHARGNIFAPDNGLGLMGPYGPAYMR